MDNRYQDQTEEVEIDLLRLFSAVLRRSRQVLVTAVICAVLAGAGAAWLVKPHYEASVLFYVTNSIDSTETHSVSGSDIAASKSLVNSCLVVLDTEATGRQIIGYAKTEHTARELRELVEAESVNGTEFFRVTISAEDPQETEALAAALAHVLPKQITEMIDGTSVKVVDLVVSDAAVTPDYAKIAVLGLLFGALLSAVWIVLRELLDSTVKCEGDIAQITDTPILAVVPKLTDSRPFGGDHDAYRILRTKLMHIVGEKSGGMVIGVSAPIREEGSTTTAVHLARVLSQCDRKVIQVDCDLRRSTLQETLNAPDCPTLVDYLNGRCGAEDLLYRCTAFGEETSFHVIFGSQNTPNAAELLDSPRMEQLLTVLRSTYDTVISDLAPIDEGADALIAAKHADGVLLVVRSEHCDRLALRNAAAQLEFMDTEIWGIVYHDRSVPVGRKHFKCRPKTEDTATV